MILNKPLHSLSFLAMLVGLALSGCGLELPSNDAPAPATVEVLPVPTPTVAATQAPQQAEDNQEAPEFPCAEEKKFCIGLVSELGTIDDKSFNQSAWQGLERASADLAAHIEYIETTTPFEYEPSIAYFADQHFDVIVTVGFGLGTATLLAADQYPDIDFIGVDQFQPDSNDNVAGLIFPENKAGFLAGALAAMVSENEVVGTVLGTDKVPPIVAFKEGYEAGAYAINPDITVLFEYHPGDTAIAFADPEWGAATALGMIDSGADVIFGAAGKTGNGALAAVAEGNESFCIGVDTDQWLLLPETHSCLLSSATKEIEDGVFELVAWSMLDKFPSGNYLGKIDLAPFHDFDDDISAEARAVLIELKAGLLSDQIPTDKSYVYPDAPRVAIDR